MEEGGVKSSLGLLLGAMGVSSVIRAWVGVGVDARARARVVVWVVDEVGVDAVARAHVVVWVDTVARAHAVWVDAVARARVVVWADAVGVVAHAHVVVWVVDAVGVDVVATCLIDNLIL